MYFSDVVSEMATAPVFKAVNMPAIAFDETPIFVDHCADLLTLVGMDQKNDLIMSHLLLLSVYSSPEDW